MTTSGKTPRSRGRTGHRWEHARRRVLNASQICGFQGNDKYPPCGELIDLALKWPHPMSASVDHSSDNLVSELDWDDERLYQVDLLTPMHLLCNQRKGTGKSNKAATRTSRDWFD